jgi:ribokinase
MTLSEGRVLVIGSVNTDLVTHLTSFPSAGETRLGSKHSTHHGGKGANQAVAAARWGSRVSFMGGVGSDALGTHFRDGLVHEGINVMHLEHADGASGVAFIAVNKDSENTIIMAPGANAALTPEALPPEVFADVDVVLLQLEIPLVRGQRALQLAFAVEAVDTTAASDALVGSLTASLAAPLPRHDDLRLACSAGAVATTCPGAQPPLPTRDDVTRFLDHAKPESAL